MLDVGLPPWLVTPSRRVLKPSCPASRSYPAESESGGLRPTLCGACSYSSVLRCSLPARVGPSADAIRLALARALLLRSGRDIVGPPGWRRAGWSLLTLLLAPRPHPPCRGRAHWPCVCRALQARSLKRWRPTSACSGARAAKSFRLPLTPLRAPADACRSATTVSRFSNSSPHWHRSYVIVPRSGHSRLVSRSLRPVTRAHLLKRWSPNYRMQRSARSEIVPITLDAVARAR